MVLAAEDTRFCQRSATPGCRASSDAISWYPISVGINAKAQRPRPKDAKRAPFGPLRSTDIDTLTQRHTRSNSVHPCNSIFFVNIEFRLRGSYSALHARYTPVIVRMALVTSTHL